MASIPTLQSLSAVKAAVMICTNANVKTELFRLPESVDDVGVANCLLEKNGGKWDETAGNTIRNVLKDVNLPEAFLEMLSCHVGSIIPEIWKWCRYLRFTFNVGHDYAVTALKASLLTSLGRVDKRAAARSVVQDETWDIRWRFEIACLFLPPEDVRHLWPQLASEHRRDYIVRANHYRQLHLVSSWACHLSRAASVADDYYRNGVDGFGLVLFNSAAADGSDVAVKYYWPMLDPSKRRETAATAFDRVLLVRHLQWPYDHFHNAYRSDGYAEVLSFLVHQMEDHQKVSILRKEDLRGEQNALVDLLSWSCEVAFLEMVKVFWSELQPEDFTNLLDQISMHDHEHYTNCDYRRLLKEFWRQAPFTFKRAVFDNSDFFYSLVFGSEEGVVKFLLKYATLEDKVALLFAFGGECRLIRLACQKGNPKFASDLLDGISLSQTDKREYLRKEFDHFLSDYSGGMYAGVERWHDVPLYYEYVEFCLQFEDEATKADLRKRMAFEMGNEIVARLIEMEKIKEVETFLQWCFSTPEEIGAFRKEFLKSCSPDIRSKLILMIMDCRNRNSSLGP